MAEPLRPSTCHQCGRTYLPTHPLTLYCSRSCRLDARNARARDRTSWERETAGLRAMHAEEARGQLVLVTDVPLPPIPDRP
jgi:hypothetical protein